MKPILSVAAFPVALAMSAVPVSAQDQDKPITDRSVDAEDVAKTPLADLNLSRDEIPALLIDAQVRPYDLKGLGKCPALIAEVGKFDAMLGPDLDLPQDGEDRVSAGRVARSVVGSFIPFRGIVRELSGANYHQRKVGVAIQAGIARRSFLKGVGTARGCDYPARAASPKEVSAHTAQFSEEDIKAAREARDRNEAKAGSGDKPAAKPAASKSD